MALVSPLAGNELACRLGLSVVSLSAELKCLSPSPRRGTMHACKLSRCQLRLLSPSTHARSGLVDGWLDMLARLVGCAPRFWPTGEERSEVVSVAPYSGAGGQIEVFTWQWHRGTRTRDSKEVNRAAAQTTGNTSVNRNIARTSSRRSATLRQNPAHFQTWDSGKEYTQQAEVQFNALSHSVPGQPSEIRTLNALAQVQGPCTRSATLEPHRGSGTGRSPSERREKRDASSRLGSRLPPRSLLVAAYSLAASYAARSARFRQLGLGTQAP